MPQHELRPGSIQRLDRPNVLLQLDAYHVAMEGENPFGTIRRAGPRIGHVQLADVPGRREPGSRSLPSPAILDALEAMGYIGPFGLEFDPADSYDLWAAQATS